MMIKKIDVVDKSFQTVAWFDIAFQRPFTTFNEVTKKKEPMGEKCLYQALSQWSKEFPCVQFTLRSSKH